MWVISEHFIAAIQKSLFIIDFRHKMLLFVAFFNFLILFYATIIADTMTLYKRREKFASLSIKVGKIFSKFPISPNQWTLLSLLPAILGFIAAYYGNILAAAIFFGLTAFFDIIDGAVARAVGKAANFGAYLDTVVDRYIEFIVIASVFFLDLPDFYFPIYVWLFALIFGSMLSTYVKSASAEKNIIKKDGHGIKGGILEHPDRLILLFMVFLLSLASKNYATYLVVAIAILSNISALQRVFKALRIAT